ncbi:MAG: DUF4132 domain-containing protein [Vicinamibacterales bacterium]
MSTTEQAEALYASLRQEADPDTRGFPDWRLLPTGQRILNDCAPALQVAVLEVAFGELLRETRGRHLVEHWPRLLAHDVINTLVKLKLDLPPDRLAAIIEVCAAIGSDYAHWMPMAALFRLASRPLTLREIAALQRLRSAMAGSTYRGPRKIVDRINDMLSGSQPRLLPGGTWSARVLADIANEERQDAWRELVRHLLTASDATPPKKWEAQLLVHLDAVGRAHFLARAIAWLDLGPMPGAPATAPVPERDASYLKGFVWALSAFDEPDVARALADLATHCLKKIPNHGAVSARVGHACIRVLARLPGTGPVTQLGRLRLRVKYAVARQLVDTAMREAAARAGITPEELEEIAGILPAQQARVEHLIESDRQIPFEQWRQHYLDHPLVGEMSRRLIWMFSEDDRGALGALRAGRIVDVNDRPLEWLSPATSVKLWHPLSSPHPLVLTWRTWLNRHGVVQPFKQAHREVYTPTDAERAEGGSNRFANHVLQQHQFAALCRERGWRYMLQGDWDSANTPIRTLGRWNLDVHLEVDAPAERTRLSESGVFRVVRTGQVRFYRDRVLLPLADVPGVAFSEAMRDVDLFIAVCSIGNDPEWRGRNLAEHGDYWQRYSDGDLPEPAKTRRGVLELLIPRLTLADRLSLEDRFVVVRGDLATYKIHLGSGHVQIEPGGRYLPIVLAPARRRNAAFPFEGDDGLSDILVKALMLAEDRKITDPVIVSLIRPS